jgi:hypothetical protein
MTKCQLASVSGTSVYEFYVNPSEYDSQDDYNISKIDILHGTSIFQRPPYDSRPRTLKWTNQDVSTIATMIAAFKARIGKTYYINFQDISTLNNFWPNFTTWNKCVIVDLKTKVKKGGRLTYDSVELVLAPKA